MVGERWNTEIRYMKTRRELIIIVALGTIGFFAGRGLNQQDAEPYRVQKVAFAGAWYDYYGNHKKGAFYIPGSRVPFAFLEDGRVTKNRTDELIGDVEGLRFETR